ncbi:hypothetical protein [Nocardia sp. NPDC050710]|uniref:hypothetical protein n=1 Tax=Nocardia sp. NPDC050710 TaxID=3157220 RepID=UPI003400EB66
MTVIRNNSMPTTMAWVLWNWLSTQLLVDTTVLRTIESRIREVLIPRLGRIEAHKFSPDDITHPTDQKACSSDIEIADAAFDHNILALALECAVQCGAIAVNPLTIALMPVGRQHSTPGVKG